jgi:glycosyltransferase involved in cell wall biosynthesis
MPLSLLEAMARGRPVATKVGGCRRRSKTACRAAAPPGDPQALADVLEESIAT